MSLTEDQVHKLSEYLQRQGGVFMKALNSATQFTTGQSNPTYLLTFSDGFQCVLRKKPDGKLLPGAHQIEREYQIMTALKKMNFPVPLTYHLCEDPKLIGTPFFLMEFVKGRIFKDSKLPDLTPEERFEIYSEHARVLAQLHGIDIFQTGLEKLGKTELYYQRQINTWTRQYKLAETNLISNMENLLYWLPQNIPPEDQQDNVCICHGDFALNNVIFHPTQPKIIAVIDWELATVGRAFADLAYMTQIYFCTSFDRPAHAGGIKGLGKFLGVPKYEQMIELYAKQRGLASLPNLTFHTAFSMFRLASIGQGVYKRALQGNASQKSQAMDMLTITQDLCKDAWELILQAKLHDPFGVRDKSKKDAAKWGIWPISDRAKSYYYRVKAFLMERYFPIENELLHEAEHRPQESRWEPLPKLASLKWDAKKEGLWNLWCTYPVVGKGLTNLEYCFVCELMGMGPFAAEIFNCSAPDTGNMELLTLYANQAQKQKYLLPLLEGEIRSCFAMTEPDVASSDATNIQTQITKQGEEGYLINGKKWYISGAGDKRCRFAIVMGKTAPDSPKPHLQQSMVIVDLPNPNVVISRPMSVYGFDEAPHGHMEMIFKNCLIPKENLIWKEGGGFEMAQGRLGGGRLHHCMRLIGLCSRVLDLMMQRGERRVIFKQKMKENSTFQQKLGELDTLLETCRQMVFSAAIKLDQFGNRNKETLKALSACKAYVPKTATYIVDEVIQVFGAAGVSQDTILGLAYVTARTLRIADGPDEVHWRQVSRFAYLQHKNNEMVNEQGYGLPKL